MAVFWYARNCRACDAALEALAEVGEDADKFGVAFVRVNDKRLAKSAAGVRSFPALSFYQKRGGQQQEEEARPALFEGDIMNEDEVGSQLPAGILLPLPVGQFTHAETGRAFLSLIFYCRERGLINAVYRNVIKRCRMKLI